MYKVQKMIFGLLLLMLGCTIGYNLNSARGHRRGAIQESGIYETETREVSSFHRLDASVPATYTISQGEHESLVIEADKNVLPFLSAYVAHDTLIIKPKRNVDLSSHHIEYHITVKDLHALTACGAASFALDGISSSAFNITLAGSMNVTGSVKVDALTIQASGCHTLALLGRAIDQTINVSGNVNYNAQDLDSKTATVHISGSTQTRLLACQKVGGSISGSSTLEIWGNPKIDVTISGSSTIKTH